MMDQLSIALVHPFVWPEVRRGGERYLDDLAWYLSRAGHRVDLIAGKTSEPLIASNRHIRRVRYPRLERLKSRGISEVDTFAIGAFPALLRRYDVVHAFTPAAALAARAARRRTVYTLLGHPRPEIFGSTFQRRLTGAAVRHATVVAALSAASARQTEATFGRTTEVLSPGVRLDRFEPELAARSGPPQILFPAAALPQKGLELLVRALVVLLERMPDARLVIGGPGDPSWAFSAAGERSLRLRAAIDVVGPGTPDDVPARYRAATVTVLPSRDDAFGLVLIESLACGTPAVCCDAGGMPEILDDPAVGHVAPYGDPITLAEAIERTVGLARAPGTPARCREHARRWDWIESVGPKHEAVYRRLVSV